MKKKRGERALHPAELDFEKKEGERELHPAELDFEKKEGERERKNPANWDLKKKVASIAYRGRSKRVCPTDQCPVPKNLSVQKKADKSRGSKGLVSADRSEAAALLGTTPRSLPKSSASDFAPLSTAEGYPRSRVWSSCSPDPECAGLGPVPSWR